MSIAAQCSDCCTCPTAAVQWDSVSASKTKCGWSEFGTPSTPPRIYSTFNANSIPLTAFGANRDDPCEEASSESYFGFTTGSVTLIDCAIGPCDLIIPTTVTFGSRSFVIDRQFNYNFTDKRLENGCFICGELDGCISGHYAFGDCTDSITPTVTSSTTADYDTGSATLSDEYTTALLKTNTVAALPAYPGTWSGTAGSYANLSTDELTYSIRQTRYRLRFKIPQTGTATCYRINWVERFIAEAGVALSSVEVYARGCYRPTVTLSAPPSGGIQARAIAVMSSTGTVTSIRILNPGSGYTSAPTVTVQSAAGGGTSSTGWTATLTAGQVTAITGGSAGDYRPTLAFSGGGGTGATATCTLDDTGGIDAVTLGVTGSGYTSEPTLIITPKVSGSTAADLLLHLGTETAKCIAWDGTIPGGYDPATPSTYPILPGSGYYELPVPTSDGTTLVANLRAVCDCTPCP